MKDTIRNLIKFMKKLLTYSLIGSSILLGSNPVKAGWDFWQVQPNSNGTQHDIYTVDSSTGNKTLRSTKTFNGSSWAEGTSYVDGYNNLVIDGGNGKFHKYDLVTDTWTDISFDSNSDSFARSSITEGEGNNLKIEDSSGNTLIEEKSNGEIHVGENSWITKEENGRQKVYAKDAAGNPIPIDYTNGTKLLINGRDVEQSINNVGALSAALTGLPTVPTDTTLACGFGTGTHGGDFAFAGGCASKVNEKLSVNYAASMTMPGQDYAGEFEDTFSARAGFVWKLGKPVKPTLISMKEKKEFETQINTLEETNKQLLARLEKLEKVALGSVQSKDLASNKINFNSLNRELKKNDF